MNLTFEGFGRDERIDEERSQWFTPMDIARKMVAWCGDLPRGTTILEPSAGSGNIVAAIRERSTMQHVHAVELDPYYADRLAARFPDDKRLTVRAGSYLDEPAPAFSEAVKRLGPYRRARHVVRLPERRQGEGD